MHRKHHESSFTPFDRAEVPHAADEDPCPKSGERGPSSTDGALTGSRDLAILAARSRPRPQCERKSSKMPDERRVGYLERLVRELAERGLVARVVRSRSGP